ncbi:MAG: ABC transporter permease subunit [Phycisphaera sp.]|nr:ABC transporter permease subunit [Phycisphaera sp.]
MSSLESDASAPAGEHRVAADWPFYLIFAVIGGCYVVLILALLIGDIAYMVRGDVTGPAWAGDMPAWLRWFVDNPIFAALSKPEIQYSITLSLVSCTVTAIMSIWVAVPVGYLMARWDDAMVAQQLDRIAQPVEHHSKRLAAIIRWCSPKALIDAILDIPIVLPPLVIGLSLLILFQFFPRGVREEVVYEVPAVVLAQFVVACAFAVRVMRATYEQIDARREQVALTLGCSRAQAFFRVVMPESMRGILTAGTLAWARALGEFGPLLIFAGATRNKTEVLSTTVFLELSIGDLEAAVAVSLIMVLAAVVVLVIARVWGSNNLTI